MRLDTDIARNRRAESLRGVLIFAIVILASACGFEPISVRDSVVPDVVLELSHLPAPPESEDLSGQTWQVGSTSFSFQRGNHVLIRGGRLSETMPTGAPGTYTYERPNLELEVLGRIYKGSVHGGELILNGRTAVYLGRTEVIYPNSVLHYPVQQPKEESGDVTENP